MRLMTAMLLSLVLPLAQACYLPQEPNPNPPPPWGAGGSGGGEAGNGGSGGESLATGSQGATTGGATAAVSTANSSSSGGPVQCGGVPSSAPEACWIKGEETCCLPENFPPECAVNEQDDSGALCGCCL